MSLVYDTNTPVATGAVVGFRFKALLKSVGWTVQSSGDGLAAFSSSSDIITGSGTGANGMANSNAWFRIQDPAANREFVLQRGTSNDQWKVKYSVSAKFTGGAPSATVIPTATDEQFFVGSTGSFGSWGIGTDGTYRWNAAADNASPYGFWSLAFSASPGETPSYGYLFIMDPMLSGSYPVADADPVVFYCTTQSTTLMTSGLTSFTSKCWYLQGLAGATFQTVQAIPYQTLVPLIIPTQGGIDYFVQNKKIAWPISWGRYVSTLNLGPGGWKGISTLMQWNSLRSAAGTALGILTARDRISFGDATLPWNGSYPLL